MTVEEEIARLSDPQVVPPETATESEAPLLWTEAVRAAICMAPMLIAYVLAQLCLWRNATTAARGAALGTLLWIGFVGPITYTTYMYEMRPWQLFAINQFYPLLGLCIMGAILGAWTKKAA